MKSVTWHPRKEIVFSTSYDDTIRVWKSRIELDDEWHCVDVLKTHDSTVWDLSFQHGTSSPSERFVTCSDDRSIIIWGPTSSSSSSSGSSSKDEDETKYQVEMRVNNLHDRTIYTVDWYDHLVASGGGDNGIRIVDTSSSSSSSSPSSKTDDNDNTTSNIVWKHDKAHKGDVNCVRWSPDGKFLASCGDDGVLNIWTTTTN